MLCIPLLTLGLVLSLVPNSLCYEALRLLKAVKMLSWIANNRFEMTALTVLC